jgi:hypothetical protein
MHAFAYASQQAVAVAEAASAKKRSPANNTPASPQSPTNARKRRSSSTTRTLQESVSAGNRKVAKQSGGGFRKPDKVITGSSAGRPAMKMKQAKLRQQVAMDIFEDLTGEEFDFEG